jgi:hypothetical protein
MDLNFKQPHHPRPSHPAAHVRDDRETPLVPGQDGAERVTDLGVRSMMPVATDWHDGQK